MHAMAWCCDGEINVGGSAKVINKSLTRSLGQILILKDETVVAKLQDWFEVTWLSAEKLYKESRTR